MMVSKELYAEAGEMMQRMIVMAGAFAGVGVLRGDDTRDIVTCIMSVHAGALAQLLHSIEMFIPDYSREQFVLALQKGIFEVADNENLRARADRN